MDRSKFIAQNQSYLTHDCYEPNAGEVLTIRDCREKTIKMKKGGSFKRLSLDFVEDRPGLDLDNTMLSYLIGTFGPDDDEWIRKKVYVFHDPTIQGKNKLALDTARDPPRADPVLQANLRAKIAGATGVKLDKEINDDIPF